MPNIETCCKTTDTYTHHTQFVSLPSCYIWIFSATNRTDLEAESIVPEVGSPRAELEQEESKALPHEEYKSDGPTLKPVEEDTGTLDKYVISPTAQLYNATKQFELSPEHGWWNFRPCMSYIKTGRNLLSCKPKYLLLKETNFLVNLRPSPTQKTCFH